MMKQFTTFIMFTSLVIISLAIISTPAHAWTTASLTNVDVTINLAEQGPSRVVSQVRFDVSGGSFHGFDLANLDGATLLSDECLAAHDNHKKYGLKFKSLRRDETRIILADKEKVKHGGITFTLVHEIDFLAEGALRWYEGRAHFDWTPITWDSGLEVMSVTVVLPGKSADAPIVVDPSVSKDYEQSLFKDKVTLTKFRPTRWYPMRSVISFDPALIPSLAPSFTQNNSEDETPAAAMVNSGGPGMPLHIHLLPLIVAILCLLALMFKALHVHGVLGHLGISARYCLLPHTGMISRTILSVGAVAVGLAAQNMGSLAASIPALAVAAALWINRREKSEIRPRPGGQWRKMDDEDVIMYRRLVKVYRRGRRSAFDITTPTGILSFAAVLAGLTYVVIITRVNWSQVGWASVINGLILAVPAWFASVRSELPVDPTLEGFLALRKWRGALSKLVGAKDSNAKAHFWVREDKSGPIEVRLRVNPAPEGLRSIEVAGDLVQNGTLHKTATTVILRIEPGTEAARKLAQCAYAAEHHLTPDLEEEIIVLRNRRGRSLGLTPLRSALALLSN